MAQGFATVKGVTTGDTLILMGRATKGPPPELQISLNGVIAPRLARGPQSQDEPFAWEARNFLRKLTLGKTVQFRQDDKKGGRAYGSVWLAPATQGGPPESVAAACVKAGWCTVSGKDDETLQAAETDAREARRGQHSSEKGKAVRDVKWNAEASTFAAKYKGTSVKALIEYVKDGANMRVLLIPDVAVLNISLAGVRCGRVNRPTGGPQQTPDSGGAAAAEGGGGGGEKKEKPPAEKKEEKPAAPTPPQPPAEPFAEEARFFVESRLLHREVDIKFASIDRFGNAMCEVSHTAGVIARELLKMGLGKVSEPGLAGVDPKEAQAMRDAEKLAKAGKLRLWRSYEPPAMAGMEKEFDAYIVEAVSGDQVSVVKCGDDSLTETRLQLSSVRAPRVGNPRSQRAGEPWGLEARDALRKLAVGKRCRIKVEYSKEFPIPGGEQKEKEPTQQRVFASIHLGSGPTPGETKNGATKDLGELLVLEGLLTTVPPRVSEERAERFDALAAAEKDAKAKKLGIHSGKAPPPPPKTLDLSGDAKRARAYLPFLTRQKSHKAFVETVFSGSRFKLRFGGENCSLVCALSAVRSPAPSSASRDADVGGDAGRAYARRYLLQRTIDASIVDMDRNGVALGSISVPSQDGDWEKRLLSRGFAKLDRRKMDQQLPGSELGLKFKAWASVEAVARERRQGLWADDANVDDFDRAQAEKTAESTATKAVAVSKWTGRIADIADGATVFMHDLTVDKQTGSSLFDVVAAKMRAAKFTEKPKTDIVAKKNAVVAASFDGEWCRAKIVDAKAGLKLRYLDYGNVEDDVSPDRLRPLDAALAALPAAAIECSLAYIAVSALDDEAGEDAARTLHSLAWGKDLSVEQHADFYGDQKHKRRVVLSVDKDDESINETLVSHGLARVPRAAKRDAARCEAGPALVDKLLDLESNAKAKRSGLWRYGDVGSDDDKF